MIRLNIYIITIILLSGIAFNSCSLFTGGIITKTIDTLISETVDAIASDEPGEPPVKIYTICFDKVDIIIKKPGTWSTWFNTYNKFWQTEKEPFIINFVQDDNIIHVYVTVKSSIYSATLERFVNIPHGSFDFIIDKNLYDDKTVIVKRNIIDSDGLNILVDWTDNGEIIKVGFLKKALKIEL